MKFKILHILDHSIPLHSGYTFRTRAILENQRKLGWKTEHLTSPKHIQATKKNIKEETIDGLHFYRALPQTGFLSKSPVLNQWAIVSSLEKKLEEVIESVKPDVIHAHSPALNGLAASRVGKRHGIPVVYEIRAFWEDAAVDHGTTTEGSIRYKLTKALETYVIKQVNAVTTICVGLKNDIISRGIPSSKITVIPNAVDPEKFTTDGVASEALKDELGLSDKSVLGFIGSFYAYEGLPLLIKSLPQVLSVNENIRVLLVGGGPQEKELKDLVCNMGFDNKVVFTGRVPHDQVQSYYNLVDIFVYPRLSMRLTELVTPLKPLEAMAQGRLVVASDVGGHKELIQNGKTGYLFPAGDINELAKMILKLVDGNYANEKKLARKFVESERSWEQSVGRYSRVYESLIKSVLK